MNEAEETDKLAWMMLTSPTDNKEDKEELSYFGEDDDLSQSPKVNKMLDKIVEKELGLSTNRP